MEQLQKDKNPYHGLLIDMRRAWESRLQRDPEFRRACLAPPRRQGDKLREILRAAGVYDRQINALLGATPKVTWARKAVQDNGRGTLLLSGPPGSGKTYACLLALCEQAMGDEALNRPVPSGRIYHASDLRAVDWFGSDAKRTTRLLCDLELVVIDDIGCEQGSPESAWLGVLDRVLDARLHGKVRTILTTNLSLPEFRRRYGDRLWRRIQARVTER